jgi:hypothetical protein
MRDRGLRPDLPGTAMIVGRPNTSGPALRSNALSWVPSVPSTCGPGRQRVRWRLRGWAVHGGATLAQGAR